MNNTNRSTNLTNTNTTTNNTHRITNGTQACAACKYQRRKCASDCVLAPYFPHDRQRQFLNAHKLFGVSNITKIIRNLSPPEKDIAMRTIMYQSDARAKDPVGGCYRIIRDLHHQIEYCKIELELVLQQLAICKAQAYQQSQFLQINQHPPHPHNTLPPQTLQNVANEDGNAIRDVVYDNITPVPQSIPSMDVCDVHKEGPGAQDVGCSSNNNDEDNSSYHQYHSLMRCYYEGQENNDQAVQYMSMQQNEENDPVIQYAGIQQKMENNENENDQFSWTPHDDSVLASSNSSTSHGECFLVKSDFTSECDGLPMKLMRLNSGDPAPYSGDGHVYETKFDDPHVDITSEVIQSESIIYESQTTAPPREEVILKEDKNTLANQDDGCFQHHIPEHDLRSEATFFTLTE